MPTFGLLPTGYKSKPFETTRTDISTAVKDKRGPSANTLSGWLGTLIDIVSGAVTTAYDIGQAIYSSLDRDKATGDSLERLTALTGTYKRSAAKSSVTEVMAGVIGTAVPADTEFRTVSTGARFLASQPTTLIAATPWSAQTVAVGQRFTSNGNIYQVKTAGVSTLPPESDNGPVIDTEDGVFWYYIGAGTAVGEVLLLSAEFGAFVGNTTDIRVIQTPVSGLNGVLNIADAKVGRLRETDESLRISQQQQIARRSSGTQLKIEGDALASGATAATVFTNRSNVVDSNGLPPHSELLLVQGGNDDTIARLLLNQVPVGITYVGNIETTLVDSKGRSHVIRHSRPTEVPIYVAVTLTYNSNATVGYPTNGDDLVKAAIVSYELVNDAGIDVVADQLAAGVRGAYGSQYKVRGVVRITSLYIGTSPSPVSDAPIVITPFQIANLDVTRITVSKSVAASV